MKTRRKSKAAAAAAAIEPDVDQSDSVRAHSEDTAGPSKPDFISPSPDAILALYRIVVSQAVDLDVATRDLEDARADIERKDVELDQALQDRESSTATLEAQLKDAQEELARAKSERDSLASSKSTLETQISTLSSSQSLSSTELDSFKHRVEDTEREKRDLLGVVSRLKEDSAQRDEEIQTLRTNLKQARQEQQTLETQLRELRSTESSTMFKLDSLTQQLQLAKDEAERTSTELAKKSEDYAKYRHEKHAALAKLQADHDALQETHASAKGTLDALRTAHNAQTHQLTQALARVQDLSARIAEQDATYAREVAGLRRLVELVEAREAQSKAIVDGVESEWAAVTERADRREAALREQVDRARARAEGAEARTAELERVLEKVNRGEFPVPAPGAAGSAPSTPARGGAESDVLTQGLMGLSPTVAMASRAQRSGKTFTEVYADHVRLQDEYAQKCAEYDRMDRTLAQVLAQIEERAPILAQQRAEYERLQSEAAQLASQLADALAERDASSSAASDASQRLTKTTRENELLQKQLNDLGRQIQALLKELGRQHDPSLPSDAALDADESTLPADTIDEVITNHLVLFRSVPALQAQNQKLLGIVREMGAKMEAEEREYRAALEREQGEAVREAHDAITALQEQLDAARRAGDARVGALAKERDALRAMLARADRGWCGRGQGGAKEVVEEQDEAEIARELAEVQAQFDAYRAEIGVDAGRLREDTLAAQREAAALHAQLAKANAKLEVAGDRHKIVQEQHALAQRDLAELTARNRELYARYTALDIECHRVSEELAGAHGTVETLRTDAANLRAEKRIWESVEARLAQENTALARERAHLSDLLANVQKMHNDIERAGENDRRRLESQVVQLENQTQDLRQQLSEERQNVRRLTLQREVETKELRANIDAQNRDLQDARTALAKADAAKAHLEQRADELARKLQGDAERLAVYERRTSVASASAGAGTGAGGTPAQLEAEVADLRAALKVAEVDLAAARGHVQQFKEISQANEEALASLHATHDEYRASTEAQLAAAWAQQETLQGSLQAAEGELAQARGALSDAKQAADAARDEWLADKKTLEDTIVDMANSEKHLAEDRRGRESDAQAHEARVRAAEERYAREVVAHAEALKAAEELKARLHELQLAERTQRTGAETAQAKLAASEASWAQQRQALDREIADLASRCKALTEQNDVLHQHLDTVSSQAARIRQAADTVAAAGEDATAAAVAADGSEAKLSELRAVINYLRKEKEIVDMQLELSKQENARLKAQLGHLARDLDDTRATLSDERERAAASATSDAQHAELVEKIQQLNLLRESNATLRADAEAHARRARELDARLKGVLAELDPLRARAHEVQAELDARAAHVARLEEENRRWQERNSQLLSKYDRVDPTEFQTLKEEVERLREEKAALETQQSAHAEEAAQHQEKIAALEKSHKAQRDMISKNNGIFRNKMNSLSGENTQLKASLEAAQKEAAAAAAERDAALVAGAEAAPPQSSDGEVERLRQEKEALERALQEERAKASVQVPAPDTSELESRLAALTQERDQLLAEKESWQQSSGGAPEAAVPAAGWEEEKAGLVKSRDEAVEQARAAHEEAEKLKEAERGLRMFNEKLNARIRDQQAARQKAVGEQEAAIKAAVEDATKSAPAPAASEELLKQHADDLKALEERLAAKHQEELKAAVDAAVAKAQETAPASAAAAPEDQKAVIEAAVAAAVSAKEQELQALLEAAKVEAIERGRLEGAMKLRLKDTQLVKAQGRLKELEAQIEELKKAGAAPSESASAPPAASPSTSTPPPASAPPPATTSAAVPAAAPARGGAPARGRPSVAGAAAAAAGQAPRGRGRGAPRGSMSIRGAGAGRGGAPAGAAAPAGGVSIMGAAAKRTREETEGSADDSLAKRLKPAAGQAADASGAAAAAPAGGGGGSGKPVTLQRNRVPPPS
ncbi:hypothetical protein BC834DRAFT_925773 [Gloeopeniophorella convolvens]|nr:hypothetical protein BC834DRAFT_925773 [Gloeopeniophorella convolvens]